MANLQSMTGMHIIIAGSFEHGYTFYGPFKTAVDAIDWATDYCGETWETIPLAEPTK